MNKSIQKVFHSICVLLFLLVFCSTILPSPIVMADSGASLVSISVGADTQTVTTEKSYTFDKVPVMYPNGTDQNAVVLPAITAVAANPNNSVEVSTPVINGAVATAIVSVSNGDEYSLTLNLIGTNAYENGGFETAQNTNVKKGDEVPQRRNDAAHCGNYSIAIRPSDANVYIYKPLAVVENGKTYLSSFSARLFDIPEVTDEKVALTDFHLITERGPAGEINTNRTDHRVYRNGELKTTAWTGELGRFGKNNWYRIDSVDSMVLGGQVTSANFSVWLADYGKQNLPVYLDDYYFGELVVSDAQILVDGAMIPKTLSTNLAAEYEITARALNQLGTASGMEKAQTSLQLVSGPNGVVYEDGVLTIPANTEGTLTFRVRVTPGAEWKGALQEEFIKDVSVSLEHRAFAISRESGTTKCKLEYTNSSGQPLNAMAYYAIYSGDVESPVLESVETLPVSIAAGEVFRDERQMTVGNHIVKCLLWNADTFMPLSVASFASSDTNAVYVATDGKDNAAGTLEDPLQSLSAARDKVREMKQTGDYPNGISVYLRGGTYQLSESLLLTEEDSGTKEAPIIWKNYGDETVTLVGGISVSGKNFKPVTDPDIKNRIVDENARNSLYSLKLSDYGITDFTEPYLPGSYSYNFRLVDLGLVEAPSAPDMEFLFNGEALTVARYPNNEMLSIAEVLDPGDNLDTETNGGAVDLTGAPFTIRVNDDRMKYWTQAENPLLYGFWRYDWADQSIPLAGISAENKSLTSAWAGVFGVSQGKKFYVSNLLEELDAPGEFYLDRGNGILYVNPPSDINDAHFTVTLLDEALIRMRNTNYVTFSGIDVAGARKKAFDIIGGSNNKIVDAEISYTAENAVSISGTKNGIMDSHIFDVNGGISLTGGDLGTLTMSENYAINNHIERFSRITKTYTSAVNVYGVGQIVMHNEIHNAPHTAIEFGGQKSKIMYNDIYDVLQNTDDAGAIYGGSTWTGRGVEIKYNYIHDIVDRSSGYYGGISGIYGDNGQCQMIVSGNVFENFEGIGVLVNGGWDNLISNNYFIDVANAGVSVNDMMKSYSFNTHHADLDAVGTTIENSAAWREQFPEFFDMMAVSDDEKRIPQGNVVAKNLAYRSRLYTDITPNCASITGNYSTDYDPGFLSLANRDYSLKNDSVLFTQISGFEEIPFAQIGRKPNGTVSAP